MRRGNPELIDFYECEIASLRSQRRLKDFFNSLLMLENGKPRIFSRFFFLSRKVKSDYNGCSNNQQAENVGDVPEGLVPPEKPELRQEKIPVMDRVFTAADRNERQGHGLGVLYIDRDVEEVLADPEERHGR